MLGRIETPGRDETLALKLTANEQRAMPPDRAKAQAFQVNRLTIWSSRVQLRRYPSLALEQLRRCARGRFPSAPFWTRFSRLCDLRNLSASPLGCY